MVCRIPSATALPTVPQKEGDTLELEPSLKARYLEFRRETPVPPTTATADNARLLLNLSPETHIATKTLWVTKVQKVTDYRVTATLEAKNCVPSNLKIPLCPPPPTPPPPPPHKPPHYAPTKPPHHVAKPPQYPIVMPPYHVTSKPPHHELPGYNPQVPIHWNDGEKEADSTQVDESV